MNNTPTPKIIQLLMSPNNSVWQGILLGLGDDGATYHCQGDTWQPYIPPLNLRDKEKELATVTEQRDAVTLRLGDTQVRMFNAERQRDRLAGLKYPEALTVDFVKMLIETVKCGGKVVTFNDGDIHIMERILKGGADE